MSLSFWIRDYVFLPLAVVRKELWWRYSALVVAMVLFGLWHKATMLFILWGAYHGILLVFHRNVEQFERKIGWQSNGRVWRTLSSISTIALISLGWILFRANSLQQAGDMLSAVISPSKYFSIYLSGSLYVLVAGLAATYFTILSIAKLLDQYSYSSDAAANRGFVAFMARNRWYWVPALYGLTLIFVLIVTVASNISLAQIMYRGF